MKCIKRLIILGSAITSGILVYKKLNQDLLTPEQALRTVKKVAKSTYAIDGSWIHMTPEIMLRYDIPYTIYRGGLTTTTDNQVQHFDFVVDAKTGTLIELVANKD